MFRSILKNRKQRQTATSFRYRGTDNTRVEALSDGIFAIATALLIISTSIPETFDELIEFMKDLVPFAICMALLMLIWYQHYVFFIRYGFKDAKIVAINTMLLFLILFYIYPLKFLFTFLHDQFSAMMRGDHEKLNYLYTEVVSLENGPDLMTIYGIGAASIFLTLAWMYRIAYNRRESLKLNDIEEFDTKSSIIGNLWMSSVPLLSVIIANLPMPQIMNFVLAGWVYMIYPFVMIPTARARLRKRNKLIKN